MKGLISSEPIRLVDIKYCLDAEWIGSELELGFIECFNNYNALKEGDLWKYLEYNAEEFKEAVNLDGGDDTVKQELNIDMLDSSALSQIKSFFLVHHRISKAGARVDFGNQSKSSCLPCIV